MDTYGLGATFYFLLTGRSPYGDILTQMKQAFNSGQEPTFEGIKSRGDPYLNKVCLDQIRYNPQDRTGLQTFKERLQLWLIIDTLQTSEHKGHEEWNWDDLAKKVLQNKKLALENLSEPQRQEIGKAILENEPPFWDGITTNFEYLTPEARKDTREAEVVLVPTLEEDKDKILRQIWPQVWWAGTVLLRAKAICGGGKMPAAPVTDDPFVAVYNRATLSLLNNRAKLNREITDLKQRHSDRLKELENTITDKEKIETEQKERIVSLTQECETLRIRIYALKKKEIECQGLDKRIKDAGMILEEILKDMS